MNYSHLIHERSLTTTPHRQKPIIEPPNYPVVFLTQKNKSNRVQLVFFVVEVRGFVANVVCVIASVQIYLQSEASARSTGFTLQSNGTMKSCKIPA